MDASTPLATRPCDLLGIRYPIVQAGMGAGIATPALVAAVANAVGLGILGAPAPPDRLQEAIRAIEARTDRPFGVNFIVAPPESGNDDVAAAQRVLDRLRAELGLPVGPPEVTLPPSSLPEQLEVVFAERVPAPASGRAIRSPSSGRRTSGV